MKKIWPWVLLLLLLILSCVWTKKDNIHVTADTHVASKQTIIDKQYYINYQLTQKGDKTYVLSGNFKNVQQQNVLSDTCSGADAILGFQGTTTNSTLAGDEAIMLTNTILPHFIANYSNGKIVYKNQLLAISGDVKGYEAKRTMQSLLNNSTIATQDNTKVVFVDPIDFSIVKDNQTLQLSGTFTNKKQIHTLTEYLRPSYSTINLRKNAQRIDKGAIALSQTILPTFIKDYTTGKINYAEEILTVEGLVDTQEALDKMNTLLSQAKIPVKNLSILNPEIMKRAEAQKEAQAAALAKAGEEAEEVTKNEALALQKDKEKARLDAEKLALETKNVAEAAKAKITKLLQIENIEFEVAKGSLTKKGEATVDKLANILMQYSHIKTEIAGHTDSDGNAVFNQKLSQERVDTVKNRLISKGIAANRLTAIGYGESQPLVPNTSDENKQKNRRVEINIKGE